MIDIRPVRIRKELRRFIDFSYDLYAGDPVFVPELYIAQRDYLDTSKNPFFDHARVELFIAEKRGKMAGRIGVVRDEVLIEFTGEQTGVFGFFEVTEDFEVAAALLDAARNWCRKQGLNHLEGPYNFSTNYPAGLLVEGFQFSPAVMMTYNKKYYQVFLEQYGFRKKTDVLAYYLEAELFPERLEKNLDLLEKRLAEKEIKVRKIDMKHFYRDVRNAMGVYNKAWSKNLGFAPFTEKEFMHVARDLKLILDPELVLLAEKAGQVIGFSLSVPDINEIQKEIHRGRLLPFGLFKLLFNKSKIKNVRILALGVLEEYRKLGLDAYFYARAFSYVRRHKRLTGGEAGWVLENNAEMNQALVKMGGKVRKKYRFYRLNLDNNSSN